MYLSSSDTIAGLPALSIRELLRHVFDPVSVQFVAAKLKVTRAKARRLISELEHRGLLEPAEPFRRRKYWMRTLKGGQVALASAAPPISRATADRSIESFLGRVEVVNSDPYYLYRVTEVVVFGSYLSTKDRLNDVDLAVGLEAKEADLAVRAELLLQRSRDAMESGKKFRNLTAFACWPEHEVLLFLKSRSRAVSLHRVSDPVLETATKRVLFPRGRGDQHAVG